MWLGLIYWHWQKEMMAPARLILGLGPANERSRYKVTPSLIGWAQNLESALPQ